MIEKVTGFKVGQQVFATIQDAQRAELRSVLKLEDTGANAPIIESFINNLDLIVDILTMRPNSKPRARKINGGTKKRKTAPADTTQTPAA